MSKTINFARRNDTLTYSAIAKWQACNRQYHYYYNLGLEPLEPADDSALRFGNLIHSILEQYYGGVSLDKIFDNIAFASEAYPENDCLKAIAIMEAYATHYPIDSEPFKIISLEQEFNLSPDKVGLNLFGRFNFAGKIDGIVEINGEHFLFEHKTASRIGDGYLEKLWADLQLTLYTIAAQILTGKRLAGAIYNVIAKPSISQSEGETEEEFRERFNKACKKNKTGTSSATRKMPETDTQYLDRLREWYANPERFIRREIYISDAQIQMTFDDVKNISSQIERANNRDFFCRNTSACFNWGRRCDYWLICSAANENESFIENFYNQVDNVHRELKTASAGNNAVWTKISGKGADPNATIGATIEPKTKNNSNASPDTGADSDDF